MFKYNNSRALCKVTRNLDCVLHSFGTGVYEDRLFLKCSGSHRIELFADFDISHVRSYRKAGMSELLYLLNNIFNNAACCIANIGYADT